MSKQAIICIKNSVGNVLSSLLANNGFDCDCRNDVPLDLINDPATFQTNGDTGIFFVWADDFYQRGIDDAVSWFTRLRIAEKSKWHNWPVIILGYDSYPTFLRYFKAPRILVSPGIEYIQLPCSLRTLKEAVDKIVSPSEAVIRDYIQDYDHTRRLGDRLTHDLGNFYAMFRLLQGAYLSELLTEDDYSTISLNIDDAQRKTLSDHLSYEEYLFLRGGRISNLESSNKPTKSQPLAEGKKILLIDDAASLGWAHVLASLLTGHSAPPSQKNEHGINILRQPDFLALGRIDPLNKAGEDTFLSSLTSFLLDKSEKDFIAGKDLIILDLRLRRQEDENVPPEESSGIRILKLLRQLNAGVPIILFTASRKAGSLEVIKQLGADEYLIKDPGVTGEGPDDIKSFYNDFKGKIERVLARAYLRDLWVGIQQAEVSDDVRAFLKQAFALIRQQPSKFEKDEFSYTPYAAAIVALGNAIEKYVNCGPREGYENAILRFYNRAGERDIKDFARYLGFMRNKAAHPQSSMLISDADARIAFMLGLWSIREASKSKQQAHRILGILVSKSGDEISRRVFSYLRKKINSRQEIPHFQELPDIDNICKSVCNSELSVYYLNFLIRRLFNFVGDRGYENVLLIKMLQRFSEIESIDEKAFQPQYEECEKDFPFVREAFWDSDRCKWYIPLGDGTEIEIKVYAWRPGFRENYSGHTQPFLFINKDQYGPWGPPIPFGKPEDELRKMLTVAI